MIEGVIVPQYLPVSDIDYHVNFSLHPVYNRAFPRRVDTPRYPPGGLSVGKYRSEYNRLVICLFTVPVRTYCGLPLFQTSRNVKALKQLTWRANMIE